jgi:hypothetical protein
VNFNYKTIINSTVVSVKHPGFDPWGQKIRNLGKRIATRAKQVKQKLPNIKKGSRNNFYTLQDYQDYADDIIRNFFKEHPLENWILQLDWVPPPPLPAGPPKGV